MAGKFTIANYERDDDSVGPIRVLSATITSWNAQATGSKTGLFIKARGSKKAYGTHARTVTLSRALGTGAPYNAGSTSVTVPILTKAAFDAISAGQTLAYAGVTDWVVAGTSAEETR